MTLSLDHEPSTVWFPKNSFGSIFIVVIIIWVCCSIHCLLHSFRCIIQAFSSSDDTRSSIVLTFRCFHLMPLCSNWWAIRANEAKREKNVPCVVQWNVSKSRWYCYYMRKWWRNYVTSCCLFVSLSFLQKWSGSNWTNYWHWKDLLGDSWKRNCVACCWIITMHDTRSCILSLDSQVVYVIPLWKCKSVSRSAVRDDSPFYRYQWTIFIVGFILSQVKKPFSLNEIQGSFPFKLTNGSCSHRRKITIESNHL